LKFKLITLEKFVNPIHKEETLRGWFNQDIGYWQQVSTFFQRKSSSRAVEGKKQTKWPQRTEGCEFAGTHPEKRMVKMRVWYKKKSHGDLTVVSLAVMWDSVTVKIWA
jgi:hypothetical protein